MNLNSERFLDSDEADLRKDEEEQQREIQALIISELDDIDFCDSEDEVAENTEYRNPVRNSGENCRSVEAESFSCRDVNNISEESSEKENNFLLLPKSSVKTYFTSWEINQAQPYYYYGQPTENFYQIGLAQQQNNNCLTYREDSSINWDLSLHGEMRIPISNSNDQISCDKLKFSNKSDSNPDNCLNGKLFPQTIKPLTRDIGVECIPVNQRELDNLELLYSARGKRIEQLQTELANEKDKRIREVRVLNHRISLLEAEQKNEQAKLKRSDDEAERQQMLLNENKQLIDTQKQKLFEHSEEIAKLKECLEARNSIVESLNDQLAELTMTRSNAKNNRIQDELIDSINRQFDADSVRLKSEIQRLSQRLDEKLEFIKKLEIQLDEQTTSHQFQKQQWLEEREELMTKIDNEKKNRLLLESSQNQEVIDQLLRQINELSTDKSISDDVNHYLKEEISDLREHLTAYENTVQLLDNYGDTWNDDSQERQSNLLKFGMSHSYPSLVDVDGNRNNSGLEQFEPQLSAVAKRKEFLTLLGRINSLTNRLLEVRKINLDFKSQLKEQKVLLSDKIEENNLLETKLKDTEKRLHQIQNGDETDSEKMLKSNLTSIGLMRDSLEQQCFSLQNQLKQSTDSMKQMDQAYKSLEIDFRDYQKMSEDDKIATIEEVKKVCDVHCENLRRQLELSWLHEKEMIIEAENQQKMAIENDLSDALKEIDRVKNLYIELSQQKSNEEANHINWNEWLSKKLEDQKRSLNQQFKTDKELLVRNLEAKHSLEMERLQSELTATALINRADKNESTTDLVMGDRTTQTFTACLSNSEAQTVTVKEKTNDDELLILSLKEQNDLLLETVEAHQRDLNVLQGNNEELERLKLKAEEENRTLKDLINNIENESRQMRSKGQVLSESYSMPGLIRSSTPELVMNTKRKSFDDFDENQFLKINFSQQFQFLKEDLISKLTNVSRAINGLNKTPVDNSPLRRNVDNNDFYDPVLGEIKEKLYMFILETQTRAATTLQQELSKSQILVKVALLKQLKQVIPLTLSVDGHILELPQEKINQLICKVIMTLDFILNDSVSRTPDNDGQTQSKSYVNSRSTSTFRNHSKTSSENFHNSFNQSNEFRISDIRNGKIGSDNHKIRKTTPLHSKTIYSDAEIRSKSESLKTEIANLSYTLNALDDKGCDNMRLIENVDKHWFCDDSEVYLSDENSPRKN